LPPPRQAPVPPLVPPLLGFVAGYVDSCTFLALFGLFVAQVTGSFVVAGAQAVTHDEETLVKVLAIPVFFLAGIVTTIMAVQARRRHRSALPGTLLLEFLLLAGFMFTGAGAIPFTDPNATPALVASLLGLSAMGVQSALVRLMIGPTSTNVMTTNTTQAAIDATEFVFAWRARRRDPDDAETASYFDEVAARCARLFPVIFSFLAGTLAGALAFLYAGLWCLALPLLTVLVLAVWARGVD
jgi:uncharacterized membrane protein YoaK (UPF0700 family)